MKKLKQALLSTVLLSVMVLCLTTVDGMQAIADTGSDTTKAEESPENEFALVINEICTSNKNCYQTETGESPDWIELYNAGNTAVNLGGIGLSDNSSKPYKFSFPQEAILLPNAHCLILCDGKNSYQGTYHANFKINASGESVYLTAADGTEIDKITIPKLDTDISYGRIPDGSESFVQQTPSPLYSNHESTIINHVAEPLFSVECGFYDDAFELTLSTDTVSTIYYTLDGSDPCKSDTAMEYQNSISIYDNTEDPNRLSAIEDITLIQYSAPKHHVDKGITVRAVCKNQEGQFSKVVTNNYFVNKKADYYHEMKVIAISTDANNFFDSEAGIYVVGKQYEDWKNSADFDPNLNLRNSKNPTNYNMQGKEWERPCNIQVFEHGELAYAENVGVRVSGKWSTAYPQKSLTLYARTEYGKNTMHYDFFDGAAVDMNGKKIKEYKKVTLRNGGNDYRYARIRDDLNQSLANGLNFGTLAKADYIVFLNGEFWGYYSMQEHCDNNYIESHYHLDKDQITSIKFGEELDGDKSVYQEWRDFWKWVKTADMSDEQNYNKVCNTIDVDSFIDYFAFQTYIVNEDFFHYNNNWFIWRSNLRDESNCYADQRFRFVLFDTDCSDNMYEKCNANIDSFEIMNNNWNYSCIAALFNKLLENPAFKKKFYQQSKNIYSTCFDYNIVSERIDCYIQRLKVAVPDTYQRFKVEADFFEEIEKIRSFFFDRPDYALQYLDKFLQMSDISETESTKPVTTTTQATTTTAVTTTPASTSLSVGDIDNNKSINANDASMILAEYAIIATNGTPNFTEAQMKAADVNDDGEVNTIDASLVLAYYAHTSTGGKLSLKGFIINKV